MLRSRRLWMPSQVLALALAVTLLGAVWAPTARSVPLSAPGASVADPGPPPLKPDQFLPWCQKGIRRARAVLTQVLAVKGQRNVTNTLEPLNTMSIYVSNTSSRAGLYANVHPDAKMRIAGETCEQDASKFLSEVGLNRQLYEAYRRVNPAGLDSSTRRLLQNSLKAFQRSGVDKPEPVRARLKELTRIQLELGQRFDANIRNDVRKVSLNPSQLKGLPDDYIKAHPAGPHGKVVVTTQYPDYFPFRTYAQDASARRALFVAFSNRGYPANDQVFKRLLEARVESAKLVGYPTPADAATDQLMVGSADKVQRFIDEITAVATPRANKDYDLLLGRKKKDDPNAISVDQSESPYYEELVRREKYAFNSQDVRPYFEANRTINGILAITSKLFGVTYRQVRDAPTWHPDVKVYDVLLKNKKIGRVDLDLFPRQGKYQHAAQFPVVSGVVGKQLPEAALVANVPGPRSSGEPSLLEHDEVVTLLHEFGHVLHHILGGAQKWVAYSGVATEFDFIEAPSQMLEEWAWSPEALQMFARHYRTNAPIPKELVARMRRAHEFGNGVTARHQLFYSAMSLAYHRIPKPSSADLTQMMIDLQCRYSPLRYVDGTHMYASFDHLNSYSALYYTYTWSLVIAKDMFSEFQKHGLFNPATARRYRDDILVPGGSQDAAVLVKHFLNRPFNTNAYAKWLNNDSLATT